MNNEQTAKIILLTGWRRAIFSVRTRLLVWYFLLTACTAAIAIKTTTGIYWDRIKSRTEASVLQQAEQFHVFVDKHRQKGIYAPQTIELLFDKLLSAYAPTRNEYITTIVNGRIYRVTPDLPANLLKPYPHLIEQWMQLDRRQSEWLSTSKQRLVYIADAIAWNGKTGVVVVLQDSTQDFQLERDALWLTIKIMLVFLGIFLLIAWITAGKVLSPLRLLTKTAQSITESDMNRRITVRGKDEIAELTATFNDMLDRLQFAFDSQKEFLKDASHELRTPITVIQGHLEMLQYCPQQQPETIALVIDELDRMSRLVNDLLVLAKADHPQFLKIKPEELDWLTEEIYLKARSFADRNWQLESKGLSPLSCDRQRLTQAMMNLVQNAVRHTQENDTIAIGSSVRGDYAYLWIRDTGEGIAPEDQKRIFERFVRATKQNQSWEGHGLGLSIVKAIAAAHHGWVELASDLGQGSTFTIILPLGASSNVATNESNSHRRRQSPHHRLSGNRTTGTGFHNHGD
jgi:signal transduction histidine kinase